MVKFAGMTGPVIIDYKGDRIMDYDVWCLPSGGDIFLEYMEIQVSKAAPNATACMEWLVCIFTVKYRPKYFRENRYSTCGSVIGLLQQ